MYTDLKSYQIHRRIFQHIGEQGVDAASAELVKMLFHQHECLPFVDGMFGHAMTQCDIDKPFFEDAGAVWQRNSITKLNQAVVIVIRMAV